MQLTLYFYFEVKPFTKTEFGAHDIGRLMSCQNFSLYLDQTSESQLHLSLWPTFFPFLRLLENMSSIKKYKEFIFIFVEKALRVEFKLLFHYIGSVELKLLNDQLFTR